MTHYVVVMDGCVIAVESSACEYTHALVELAPGDYQVVSYHESEQGARTAAEQIVANAMPVPPSLYLVPLGTAPEPPAVGAMAWGDQTLAAITIYVVVPLVAGLEKGVQ